MPLMILVIFQNVGNSQREYEKLVVAFSVKNQLRYKGNLGMSCSLFALLAHDLLVRHWFFKFLHGLDYMWVT